MANFFRVGPDLNAAMAAEVAPDQPEFGAYVEHIDHSASNFRIAEVASPHLTEIQKFDRDLQWARAEQAKLIRDGKITNEDRFQKLEAAAIEAQMCHAYAIQAAANYNQTRAVERSQSGARLREEYGERHGPALLPQAQEVVARIARCPAGTERAGQPADGR